MLKKIMLCTTLFFIWCNSYATDYKLTNNTCLQSEIKSDLLLVYHSDCKKKRNLLGTFQVPNDIPKINFVFQEIIKKKKYIFLSISYSENYRDADNKINYADKYYLNYAYQCEKECKLDNNLSYFFGNGGNLIDIHTDKLVYIYPYSSEQSIKSELNSDLFRNWLYNTNMQGKVLKKTYINEENNFSFSHTGYLIKDDQFIIKDVNAKWLNIVYINKKGEKIIGWIDCNDTDVCNN